jgi:hypothetical protein
MFEQGPVFVGEIVGRQRKLQDHFGNAPGIGSHNFGDLNLGAGQIQVMAPGNDAHNGHHTRTQGRAHQIGRRKGFSPSVIVHRGIGD